MGEGYRSGWAKLSISGFNWYLGLSPSLPPPSLLFFNYTHRHTHTHAHTHTYTHTLPEVFEKTVSLVLGKQKQACGSAEMSESVAQHTEEINKHIELLLFNKH